MPVSHRDGPSHPVSDSAAGPGLRLGVGLGVICSGAAGQLTGVTRSRCQLEWAPAAAPVCPTRAESPGPTESELTIIAEPQSLLVAGTI